jgi:preprotein translocase subunit SecE
MVTKALGFLTQVKAEVKKVTWPSRREALGGTAVVVAVVFLMSLFLGLVDAMLAKLIQGLVKI